MELSPVDIYYNLSWQCRTDADNCRLNLPPHLRYKEQPWWNLHLFADEEGNRPDLSGITSCRAAVDVDLMSDTEVMCRSLGDSIDLSSLANGTISVRLDANTTDFLRKVDGKENLAAKFELWGYSAHGEVELYLTFRIVCSGVVDPEGGLPPEPVEGDPVIRASDLEARIARKLIMEYSADGISAHAELVDGDQYYRIRHGENGEPSAWQPLLYGPPGSGTDGKAATIAIGTVTDVEYEDSADVENAGTANAAVLNFKLRAGKPGKDGEDGKDGTSFGYDASGELSERGVYDGEAAGFVFAAVVNDAEARTATWYFYKKRSSSYGDWYDPLIKVEYGGRDGANSALIPCVEFTAPPGILDGTRYLTFTLKNYPAAWVSAVVIDTPRGEVQLPFNHDQGIRQIYKRSGAFYLYFGANVPAFDTGRVYFAQGISPERENDGVSASITALLPVEFTHPGDAGCFFINVADMPEAAITSVAIDTEDGELVLPYGSDRGVEKILRNDNKLFVYLGTNISAFTTGRVYLSRLIAADTSSIPSAPVPVNGNIYYGFFESSTMTAISQISAAELTHPGVITSQGSSGKFEIGPVTPGSWTVVLLPEGLTAKKDDGFGGKVEFSLHNGAPNTGANGTATVTIDGSTYRVFGEFNLVAGNVTIYIEEL